MDNKSLVVSKKSFFYKIKMFIKSIFKKEETYEQRTNNNYTDYNNSINQQEKKTSFVNEIKIETDKEREKYIIIRVSKKSCFRKNRR